jgi:hypothetical protein
MSMTDAEYEYDEARSYFDAQRTAVMERLMGCHLEVDFAGVRNVTGRGIPELDEPMCPYSVDHMRSRLDHAEALLVDPHGVMGDEWGPLTEEVALEAAAGIIAQTRRMLMATARNTRSLRSLMALGLSLNRLGALHARIAALRSPGSSHTPSRRPRTGTVADVVRSLTQAAHAPPRVAVYRSPSIAGGGPL